MLSSYNKRQLAALKNISCALLLALASALPAGQSGVVAWGVNGPVRALLASGPSIYLGGDFDYAGPYTGSGVALDSNTGALLSSPRIDGPVYVVIADGSGGWYLGGHFFDAGLQSAGNLLHLHSDLSIDPNFVASSDSSVFALALNGSNLYVGGSFAFVNGVARSSLAAVDASSGSVLPFNPSPNNYVYALALSNTVLYAGGAFTSVNGLSRPYLAALDASGSTGWATAFNPSPDRQIDSLLVSGSTLYAGGRFLNIGGATQNYLAALDTGSALATAWNPGAGAGPGNYVSALALSGTTLYAGGLFSSMGGQSRSNLAALDTGTGLATAFSADCDQGVDVLALSGSALYLGGLFTQVGGAARKRLAAINASSGAVLAWDPVSGGEANGLAVQGSQAFAGGSFVSVGGLSRAHLAAFDATSLSPNSFNPGLAGPAATVNALALSGTTLYVGGTFSQASQSAASNLAAISTLSGLPQAFGAGADGAVHSLAWAGSSLYVGGDFQNCGGQPRSSLAALDSSGSASIFNPTADNQVLALAPYAGGLFAGGAFSHIGGQPRGNLAALAASSGAALGLSLSVDSTVLGLSLGSSLLYAGGNFTAPRQRLVAISLGSGSLDSFDPAGIDGIVNSLLLQNGRLYIGGAFLNVGGQGHEDIAALDPLNGKPADFFAYTDGPVNALAGNGGSRIYLGGNFSIAQGNWQQNFAVIDDLNPANIAGAGDIVAYPQPARTRVCFSFSAPSAGQIVVDVYNFAMQHVASFRESVSAGQQSICEPLGPIVGGFYFYKASLNGTHFPTRKLWVLR